MGQILLNYNYFYCFLSKTKVFHKFIKSPSVKDSFDIDSVLKMLKLDKNDELALKFWQAGLSDECKVQIRNLQFFVICLNKNIFYNF